MSYFFGSIYNLFMKNVDSLLVMPGGVDTNILDNSIQEGFLKS